MDDMISRQAAIDALDVLCQEHRYRIPGKSETYSQYNEAWQDALGRAENAIGNLPSVQPEKRTEERMETHACDLISRIAVYDRVDRIVNVNHLDQELVWFTPIGVKALIAELPSAQPEPCEDAVSRQAAIDKFIDGLEDIFADLRERHVDDSVCGLCEYDGAYIGQSGNWCNECPGFEKDDCFKLSDKTRKEWTEEIIKALPSAQPELRRGEES